MADPITITLNQVESLSRDFFLAKGFSQDLARTLSLRMRLAERDGPASHGLAMLTHYHNIVGTGLLNLSPKPVVRELRPAFMVVDCDNSFSQAGIDFAHDDFVRMVKATGTATLITQRAHHIGALRHDVLPLAEKGLIVIMMSGSRPSVVPHGGHDAIFGTNPMAFACPCAGRPPIVWDQAVSIKARFDVRLAGKEGKVFSTPMGLNTSGEPSVYPEEILNGGHMFTYGDHKGTAIALMIEIMAAGLSGGKYAVEHQAENGLTNAAGQTIIAIDPGVATPGFTDHLTSLIDAFNGNGAARIPGDGRLGRADVAEADGVALPGWLVDSLSEIGFGLPS